MGFPLYLTAQLLRLRLQGTIYHPDYFVSVLHYCVNLKAIIYKSMSLADRSHRVIVAFKKL